jgi:Cu(I)-responsive transcriptional regulator
MSHLTTGGLARRGGVNLETIRYYERRGLLPKPPRTVSGYRAFAPDAVRSLRFVKRAQALGFSLKEIKELLSLRAAPRARSADVRAQVRRKIDDIERKLRSLAAMKKALLKLVDECSGRGPVSECPILESVSSGTTAV